MNFKSLEGLTIVKVKEEWVESIVLTMSDGKSYRIDAFLEESGSKPGTPWENEDITYFSVLGFMEEV